MRVHTAWSRKLIELIVRFGAALVCLMAVFLVMQIPWVLKTPGAVALVLLVGMLVGVWLGKFDSSNLFHGVVSQEITERTQTHDTIARLTAIVESCDDAMISIDLLGRVTSWNRGAERIFGYSAEEMIHQPIYVLIPADRTEEASRSLEQLRNGERVSPFESKRRTKDGLLIDVFLTLSPICNDAGQLIGTSSCARDISELLRSTDALQSERNFLANIIAGAPAIICRVAMDGTTLFLNSEGEKITGYSSAELVGKNWWQTIYPGEAYSQVERLLCDYQVGDLRDYEMMLLTKEGEKRTVSWNLIRQDEEKAKTGIMIGFGIDITQRKATEKALDQSRAQLWTVVENLTVGIVLCQLDGLMVHWNRAALQIHGYTDISECRAKLADYPELFELSYREDEILPFDDWPMVRILRGEQVHDLELRVRNIRDGWSRILSCGGTIVRDPDGRPLAFLTINDITNRKAAETALRDSEDRYALAAESAGLGAWDVDLINGRRDWSPRQQELFGFAPGTFDGTWASLIERIHPEDREELEKAYFHARETRQLFNHELRVVLSDGSIRWLADFGRYFYKPSGVAVRMVGVTVDITERKKSEDNLNQYAKRLETFHKIDQAILAANSPKEIARVGLTHLALLVPYWKASVAAYDFEAEEIEIIVSLGAGPRTFPDGQRFPITVGIATELELLWQGRSVVVEDLDKEAKSNSLFDTLRKIGTRSYVRLPLLYHGELIGSLNLGSNKPGTFAVEDVKVAQEVADQMAIALKQAMLFDEVKTASTRLETLSRRLIRAEEEERRRISRELHDESGQNLTALKLLLQGSAQKLSQEERERLGFDESIDLADQTLQQIRDISLALRPTLLDDLGLVAAIRSLVARQARVGGFEASFLPVALNPEFRLEPDLETACFRLVQEVLTNVVRYASAKKVHVELHYNEDEVNLVVSDDGIGFDVAAALTRAEQGASLGLIGMRERVGLLGGRITLQSQPGIGSQVFATFPISSSVTN